MTLAGTDQGRGGEEHIAELKIRGFVEALGCARAPSVVIVGEQNGLDGGIIPHCFAIHQDIWRFYGEQCRTNARDDQLRRETALLYGQFKNPSASRVERPFWPSALIGLLLHASPLFIRACGIPPPRPPAFDGQLHPPSTLTSSRHTCINQQASISPPSPTHHPS
ncbi:hypothetical protein P154DRAFT_18483 [Amniculicola lignicola CBS 123094]|uniref:Uncharacterized protein n=1 Tax=Amniculicola lignicola CBS 123094 TaxID=1392246 RepID=A0A6A5X5I5_9PLEO|nr:hypothetical protein P154DRAFT_18483 [Amniculicola lignicola CBS 123094]